MTVPSFAELYESDQTGSTTGRQLAFPIGWFAFGALMVGALAFCYLIEESSIPTLQLTSWLIVWLSWIPLSYGLSACVAHRPIDRANWKRRLPTYLLGGSLVVALLLVLRVALDSYFHVVNGSEFSGFRLRAFLVQSVVYDVFAFVSFLSLAHASNYYRRWTERQVRDANTQARMAEIQLGFLKAQLQPHFLLNSLNLISGQLYENVERADAMIADLGGLLRATLASPDQHEVPLVRELELLELYLDIARTRFGTALTVEQQIDPKCHAALVPSLVLQPLVENSIRHGMSGSRRVSRIVIRATRDPYNLLLTVSDDGPGLADKISGEIGSGIGIGNTRRRLEQLYGSDHRFSLTNRSGGGVVATIEIPFRPAVIQQPLAKREAHIDHTHADRRRRAVGP